MRNFVMAFLVLAGAHLQMVRGEAPPLVIKGGTVFDSVNQSMVTSQAIVIRDGKIVALGTPQKPVEIPKDSRVIDASGQYLLPGLIDAHVHLVHRLNFAHITGDEVLPLYLAAGVTSVRSTGDEIVAQTGVARFAEAHPDRCPRVFTASFLIDADPPIHRDIGFPISDPAKVPALIEDMMAWKVRTLKIYAGSQRAVGRKVIEEGHRRGLFVTGHLGGYRAQDAAEDGIDGIEHITSVFDFAISPDQASKPNPRATVDLKNVQSLQLMELLAKKKVLVDPTLTVFKNMLLLSDLEEVNKHPDNSPMPGRLRRYWDSYRLQQGLAPATREIRKQEFAKYQELAGLLQKAGVRLLVGTDSPEPYCPPGFSLHQEMELLVQSGLKPAEVLQAATLHNALALKEQDRLGVIGVGKVADIILLEKDPTADIRNTRSIVTVIRGGLVCEPSKLLKAVPVE